MIGLLVVLIRGKGEQWRPCLDSTRCNGSLLTQECVGNWVVKEGRENQHHQTLNEIAT